MFFTKILVSLPLSLIISPLHAPQYKNFKELMTILKFINQLTEQYYAQHSKHIYQIYSDQI